jgi:hypothetical protein
MAKMVWKTTPSAAYEWAELEGGDTMSQAERAAFVDEFVTQNGLVPVESTFMGDIPTHRFGRYKADFALASALPVALPGRESDLRKANDELAATKAELARALEQLGKKRKGKENVVDTGDTGTITAAAGGQTTEEARANLNTQDGVNLVGNGEEVREDMGTADRSDDNPKK